MQEHHIETRPNRIIDITGQRFGRLVATEMAGRKPNRTDGTGKLVIFWKCVCDCGTTVEVRGGSLRNGDTQSCGCLQRDVRSEANTTHGLTKVGSPTRYIWSVWSHMVARCHDENEIGYHNYGGRGISVCCKWRWSLEAFYADMGDRPSPKHRLDRIENNKGYWCGTPECIECCMLGRDRNVRWATQAENMRNTRRTVHLTLGDRTMCLKDWATELGINPCALKERLERMTVEEALTMPRHASSDRSGSENSAPVVMKKALLGFMAVQQDWITTEAVADATGLKYDYVKRNLRINSDLFDRRSPPGKSRLWSEWRLKQS